MKKVLEFFNQITGLMVFLILAIVFITHLQISHHHFHHGYRNGKKCDRSYCKDSCMDHNKKDTTKAK